jgi:hypothetical protein
MALNLLVARASVNNFSIKRYPSNSKVIYVYEMALNTRQNAASYANTSEVFEATAKEPINECESEEILPEPIVFNRAASSVENDGPVDIGCFYGNANDIEYVVAPEGDAVADEALVCADDTCRGVEGARLTREEREREIRAD